MLLKLRKRLFISTEAETLDFSPLERLRVVGGEYSGISVAGNPNLTSISGFSSLERSLITISGNENLRTVAGFWSFERGYWTWRLLHYKQPRTA